MGSEKMVLGFGILEICPVYLNMVQRDSINIEKVNMKVFSSLLFFL